MGQAKLLLPWQGKSLIEHVLDVWQQAAPTEVLVVVRADDERLIEIVERSGAHLVVPKVPPPEMKFSVRAALDVIERDYSPDDGDAWLLAPADMPQLEAASIRRVLDAHREREPSIIVPTFEKRRGHPVLFPWPLAAAVSQLGPDEGVNALLRRHPVRLVEVASPGVLSDVDTPEDYRRVRESE